MARPASPVARAVTAPPPSSIAPGADVKLAIVAALFCFSAGPVGVVIQRLLVAKYSPFLIIAVQMTIGAVLLWLARLFFPKVSLPRSAVAKGLVLGILHPGAFMIVYTMASGRLDSVTAVLLLALVPAFVAIAGWLVLKETLRPVVMIGILVSLAGLGVLVSERQPSGESEPLGYALGVTGLVLASGSVVAGRALNTGAVLPWFVLAPLQVTGAAVVAWVGVLAMGVMIEPEAIASDWPAFAYLAVGMTAASYFAYNFALSRLATPTIGLLSSAGPGVGALAAAWIFATAIGPLAALGIAIILAGATLPSLTGLLARRRAREAQPPPPPLPASRLSRTGTFR